MSTDDTASAVPSAEPLHLLMVEDDDSLRESWEISWALCCPSVRVSVAEDGYQALLKIATDPPQLVITDLNMPVLNGRELIEMLGRDSQHRHLPVIVTSGDIADDLLEMPSVVACLSKPVSFAGIRRYVVCLREILVAVGGNDPAAIPQMLRSRMAEALW